jgi:integrase
MPKDGEPAILGERDIERLVAACSKTRYPIRNRAIVLLAAHAGLTPLEMSWLKRYSIATNDGLVGGHIDLQGKEGKRLTARKIPIAPDGLLRKTLIDLLENVPATIWDPAIISERALEGGGATKQPGVSVLESMRPTSITFVLWKLAERAGVSMDGSRDARRSFIVRAGRALRLVGGNARDLQEMVGHRSLESTQRFMDADWMAQNSAIGTLFSPKA